MRFIKFKPLYDNIVKCKRKELGYGSTYSKEDILDTFYGEIDQIDVDIETFDVSCIDILNIYDLEIVYQLIPANTHDVLHIKIFEKTLPFLASQLMCDENSLEDKIWKTDDIYWQRLNIFSSVSHFLLMRKTDELDAHIKCIVKNLCVSDETASFIEKFIFAADSLNRYENFWMVWNKFYPQIKKLSSSGFHHHLKSVIINYLLAFSYWNEGIDEWHVLTKEDLPFYSRIARELGHIPFVLLAIIKVLNSIGAKFEHDGILWLHTIISNNINMKLGGDEQSILFYLENFLRKFVFINKQKIKKDVKLKGQLLQILNFMIERGSTYGFMLRESIL